MFGLLRVRGIDLALPLAVLREVVPCPLRLDPLPTTSPAVQGAMHLRRTVLPVVDLAVLLRTAHDTAPQVAPQVSPQAAWEQAPGVSAHPGSGPGERFVVVVADGGRLVGLVVDELRGVGQVPARLVQDVHAQRGALLLSGAFTHPDTDHVVSVLDVGVLLQSTGVPTIPDRGRGQSTLAVSRTAGGGAAQPGDRLRRAGGARPRVLTLVRAGEHPLALDVAHVHTTLSRVRPTASVLTSDLCLGVVQYAGREVPVVDPLVLLGLGRLDRVPEHAAGLVLDLGAGYVVMALDELVDLQEVGPEQVLTVDPFALPSPNLFAGLLHLPARPACLLMDGHALLSHDTLQGMAAVNVTVASGPGAGVPANPDQGTIASPRQRRRGEVDPGPTTSEQQDRRPHLAYQCGVRAVTPLEQVSEVVPYQATLIRTSPSNKEPAGPSRPALLGLFPHRGAAVPVLDLSQKLGLGPSQPTTTACLLLVHGQRGPVAFLVHGLDRIETVAWADPDHLPDPGPDAPGPSKPGPVAPTRDTSGPLLERAQLVRLDRETQLLPRLDLGLLAACLEDQ